MIQQTITANRFQQPFLVAISTLLILAAISIASGLAISIIVPLFANWWLLAAPIPVILIGYHYRERLSPRWCAALSGLNQAIVVIFCLLSFQIILSNIQTKPEWDIKNLWLHARMAVQGENFYDLEAARELANRYPPTSQLLLDLIDFPYPPPSMLLVAPMGWFEMDTAFPLWQIVHMIFLGYALFLMQQLFLPEQGWAGLALVGVMVAVFHPTIDTIYAGQTTFLTLLLLMLYWRDRKLGRSGVWLAIAIFVKPFMAILLLYIVFRRQWPVLRMVLVSIAAACILSIVVFGLDIFVSYFTDSPLSNYGTYRLTMTFNQSLLATILRFTQYDFSSGSGFMHPLFLVSAGLLTLCTAWMVYRCGDQQPNWTLALVLVLALLVYPHSLRYYAILLVPPFLLIWSARERLPGGVGVTVIILSLLYGFAAYRPGDFIFMVMLSLWFILAFMTLRLHGQTMPAVSATIQ